MTANSINGYFNTLNVNNDNGRIRLDIDGNLRMVGQKMFMNIVNGLDLRTDYSSNFTSLFGDLLMNAETGHIKIESGAIGSTSIYLNNTNTNGGITLNSGLSGSTLTSTGLIIVKSTGNDINIGYADNNFETYDPLTETQNITIEAQYNVSINCKDFQVVATDTINLIANEINIGPSPTNPFLRIIDDCLLIDSTSSIGLYKVLIDVDTSSYSKPDYNGLLIRSLNDDISTDITVQSNIDSNNILNNFSFGIEALNSVNGIAEEYIAYKVGNKIIQLEEGGFPINDNDIGKSFYWVDDEITETIIGFDTYITEPYSYSSFDLTTSGTYTGSQTKYYKIVIDDSTSNPNKFKWSNDGGNTYVDELVDVDDNTGVNLGDGINIIFPELTGFTVGIYWTFTALVVTITNNSTNRLSQKCRILKENISYLTVEQPNDIQIKTSNQERLRITDNGYVGIGVKNPSSTLEVKNKVGERILLSIDYLNHQINPSVAGLSNGGWVAVWESYNTNTTIIYDIYGQIFYPDGTRNGPQFRVNTTQTNTQSFPFVVATVKPNSGRFLVVWSSDDSNLLARYDIKAQIFDADLPVGQRQIINNDILINTTITNSNKYPRAISLYNQASNFPYVITWSSNYPDGGTGTHTYFQIVAFNGNIINTEVLVNVLPSLSQTYPDITFIDNTATIIPNGFIITYMYEYDINLFDIRYQLYNSIYLKVGDEVIISKSENPPSLNPSLTFGRVSIKGLLNDNTNTGNGGDFIVCFNKSYYGDSSKLTFLPPDSSDTLTGTTSSAEGYLKEIDVDYPTLIKVKVLDGVFLIGEEFTTNFSNIIERIENIYYPNNPNAYFSLDPDEIEITLSRDIKLIRAVKYNTSSTLPLYTIYQVNTTDYIDDEELQYINPAEWTRQNTIFNYSSNLPVITQTSDKNFIICWSNNKNPKIYYQKFNNETGNKIGDETILQSQNQRNGNLEGISQRNPAITQIKNKNNQDCGLVVVYDAETFDTSQRGVYGELINNENPLMKVWNGTSLLNFSNNGFLGIGSSLINPESSLHIKNQSSNIILQNTETTLGDGKCNSKIIFKDSNSNDLVQIKGAYTTSYETRNPKFENLIRWFKFDDLRGSNTAKDSSQYNLPATLKDFDVFDSWVDGKINNALNFNGSSYLKLEFIFDESLLSIIGNSFTISSWIKVFEGGSNGITNTIFSTGLTNSQNFNLVLNSSSQLVGTLYTDIENNVVGTSNLADGLWHNVIFTFDITGTTNQLKLYVDGSLESQLTINTNFVPDNIINLYIGSFNETDDFFIGSMDDFRIYNTPLSSDDILLLYQNVSLTKGKIVIKTNNGTGILDDDANDIRNFTIDSDGFIENLKTRSIPDLTLTGTLTFISGNRTITGSNGSLFLTEINIGDSIVIETFSRVVIAILDNTHFTINEPFPNSILGGYNSVQRRPSMLSGLNANSQLKLLLTAEGKLSIGNPDTGGKLVISGDNTDLPTIYLKNYQTSGSTNIIGFFGKDALDAEYEIGNIKSSVSTGTNGLLKFYLNSSSQVKQVLALNDLGYLGLGGNNLATPLSHLHIVDEATGDVNILLESGSNNLEIGGAASNIKFKFKDSSTEYANIRGSSDNTTNNARGRLDFFTTDTDNNSIQRLSIKSNNGISFYLPEPVNTFHISPPQNSFFGGSASLSGTTVLGLGTSFNANYVDNIIYFITDKISRIITGYTSPTQITVSSSGTISNQPYYIYRAGLSINSDGFIGMGTAQQTSSVHLQGSLATETVNISYTDTDLGYYNFIDNKNYNFHTFLINTTGGQITMNLPPVETIKGRIYNFKKVNSSINNVVLNAFTGQYIDANAQYNLTTTYQSIIIQSDGYKWNIISSVGSGSSTISNTNFLPEGSSNLYFTNQRAINAVGITSTANLPEGGTHLYFTDLRAINAVGITSTASLAEGGTNLYFTVQRAIDAVGGIIGITSTDFLTEGTSNLYFTPQRAIDAVGGSIGITSTDFLTEGTSNLYFTVQRAIDAVGGNIGITSTDFLTEGTSNLYFTPQRAIDAVGITSTASLEEGGTHLYFTDLRAINAVGITSTASLEEGGTHLYFTDLRAINAVGITSTASLEEGGTHLYFTDLRAINAVGITSTASLEEGGTHLYFTDLRAINAVGITSTASLEEGGTHLYFTDLRAINAVGITSTASLEEGGTHLYFTDLRARNAIPDVFSDITALYLGIDTLSTAFDPLGSAQGISAGIISIIDNLTTEDIPESGLTNLYFSNTRVMSAISSGITTSYLNTTDLTVSGNLSRTVSTVTQITSIATSVTINSLNGLITTVQMTLAALSGTEFTVSNNTVSVGDLVFIQINGKSGTPQSGLLIPMLSVYAVANGSFNIILRNFDTTTDCTGVYDIAFQIIKKI